MSDEYEPGYGRALRAAGAVVHAIEMFGSYQGDWWALVTYEGRTGFVSGSFGSCSVCDAFESEFGDDDSEADGYADRLAEFGRGYLTGIMPAEKALAEASANVDWDLEADSMAAWAKARAAEMPS